MESKNDRFKRLATNRVNTAIKTIELIGNLSNRNSYSYSEDEVKKIFNILNDKIKEANNRFKRASSASEFKL